MNREIYRGIDRNTIWDRKRGVKTEMSSKIDGDINREITGGNK